VICNEGELLERFGIKVIPRSLLEIVNDTRQAVSERASDVKAAVDDFKRRVDFSQVSEDKVKLIAALKLVLIDWCDKECLSGVAFQCWTALQDALGIMPCFVDSELTGMGLPVACETDIHGAITAVMLQAARLGQSPTFFADLTIRHPKNDNAELLWHCGPFPLALAVEGARRSVGHHYVLPAACPGVAEWRVRGGEITIARFDGDHGHYSIFLGHARGTDGPHNRGTYVWVEVNDWPLWEEKIIRGPYIHHVVGVHGHVSPALYEACRYIPGLRPDPVDPSEEQIRAWLRGA
jgi:L-fucose isomerase-like protein